MEMRKITLGDCIIDCASGPFGSNLKVECFVEDGFPIIDGANLKGVRVTDNITKFVTEEKARSLSRSIAKRRDVIVTISGTLGQISFIPNDSKYNEYLCSQRQFRVTFDESKIDVEYLVNYLHTDFGQKKILSFANYVGVPALAQPLPNFKKIELLIPSIQNQKKVVQVLSALDGKIALNKKMNQKLEAMAKRLYDYWFVQYDFPDKNGHPYKITGGPMTYNPTLKREIPEGWEVDVVGNVCETVLGGTPSTENESFWNGNIPWLNSGEVAEFPILNAEKRITEDAVKNSATAYLPAGSVTLSITRHLRPSIMAIDACINQSVAGIKENDILKNGYLYPYLVNEIPRLNTLRGGAQQPHINKDTVDKSPIALPTQNVLHQYYEKVNPLYNEIIEKAKESQKLTTLRDKLLPLLMNGQVEVE